MSILSKLFGRSKEPEPFFVRTWTKVKLKELSHAKELTDFYLFVSLMYGLCTFLSEEKVNEESEIDNLMSLEDFKGDAALFELGCYLLFRVNVFLFENYRELRNELLSRLANLFIALFEKALNQENIGVLFDQRFALYEELLRKSSDIEEYHFYLSQLIAKTKGGKNPIEFDKDRDLEIKDPGSMLFLKMNQLIWEKELLPVCIQNVENFIKMV